ncbi:MAG TPA: hypothetical protein VHZ76_07445 [Gammaproteobacteria bacterium]|jgi:hypothetical protein|nr:hypothetical protein [Gammaproteobacteria bacterium]
MSATNSNQAINKTEIKQESVVDVYNAMLDKLKNAATTEGAPVLPKINKTEEKIVQEKARVITLAAKDTPMDLVREITELKQTITNSLEDVKTRLLPEYERFDVLRKAIAYSEEELKNLYGIKEHAYALEVLLAAQKEKTTRFEEEIRQRKHAFEEERMRAQEEWAQAERNYQEKRDLAREMEKKQAETARSELEEELSAKRLAFKQECEVLRAMLDSRKDEYDRLKNREARIASLEQEYELLKEKVARFPEELQSAIQRTQRVAGEQLERKHEYELKLLQIEISSERNLYEQKIAALEQQIEQYKTLKKLFNQANMVSTDMLGTADGSSSSNAMGHTNIHKLEKVATSAAFMNDDAEVVE